jgi:hypothetical protein
MPPSLGMGALHHAARKKLGAAAPQEKDAALIRG